MKRNFTKILRPALLMLLMLLMLAAPTVMAASSSELDALEDLLAAATSQREAAEKAISSAFSESCLFRCDIVSPVRLSLFAASALSRSI